MCTIQVTASQIDRIMSYCGVTFLVTFFAVLILRNAALLVISEYAVIILGVVMLIDVGFVFFRDIFTRMFLLCCVSAPLVRVFEKVWSMQGAIN
jgi:hypothetical protein